MCGLAGMYTEMRDSRLRYAMQLLGIANTTRGIDSWGIFTFGDTTAPKGAVTKKVDSLTLSFMEYSSMIPQKNLFMVHTRAASVGDVEPANAHPFRIASGRNWLVGAHNGGIRNHEELNDKYKRAFDVDSMHIFAHILEGKDSSELKGRGAITYVHNGQFYLAKFNGGDLSVAQIYRTRKGGAKIPLGILWSSSQEHLHKAMVGAGFQDEEWEFYDLRYHRLYRYEGGILLKNAEFEVESPFVGSGMGGHHGNGFTSYGNGGLGNYGNDRCHIGHQSPRSTTVPGRVRVPRGDDPIAVILRITAETTAAAAMSEA